MSTSEPTPFDHIVAKPLPDLRDILRLAAVCVVRPVQFVAFWVATLLPLTYLPMLATGVVTGTELGFAGLLGLNAVAFVLGHSHNRP